MTRINTNLVLIPVDHNNTKTSYYHQEELCKIALKAYKPGDVIAVEDDGSKTKDFKFFAPLPKEARVVGWYDPQVYAFEQKLVKLREAINHTEQFRNLSFPSDINALNAFIPDKMRWGLELSDLIRLARLLFNCFFNRSFRENWPKKQKFLMDQIETLSKENVNTIYLIGGRQHFDDSFLRFVISLGITYQVYDQQPKVLTRPELPEIAIVSN